MKDLPADHPIEVEGTGMDIPYADCLHFLDMTENHPGWKVWLRITAEAINAEREIVARLNLPIIETEQHRAVLHTYLADVEFPNRVKRSVAEASR